MFQYPWNLVELDARFQHPGDDFVAFELGERGSAVLGPPCIQLLRPGVIFSPGFKGLSVLGLNCYGRRGRRYGGILVVHFFPFFGDLAPQIDRVSSSTMRGEDRSPRNTLDKCEVEMPNFRARAARFKRMGAPLLRDGLFAAIVMRSVFYHIQQCCKAKMSLFLRRKPLHFKTNGSRARKADRCATACLP